MVFSQNLSFEELLHLQKENKASIHKFLNEKAWQQDAKSDYVWIFENIHKSDSLVEMLLLRDVNCNQNILYYKTSDSLKYAALRESSLKASVKQNSINYPTIHIEDYYLTDLYLRFYETHEPNQLPVYAVWIFSKADGWYFGELNKFCFPNISSDSNDKPVQIFWYWDDNVGKPNIISKNDKLRIISLPEFPGGDDERIKFIEYNLKYPLRAKAGKIDGDVTVSFVIEKNGSINNIHFQYGHDGGIDEEIQRVVELMPRWIPATENGLPIRTLIKMPIKFILKNNYNTGKGSGLGGRIPTITY